MPLHTSESSEHVGPLIGDMVMASREKQALGLNTPNSHRLAACAGHVRASFSKKFVQGVGDGPCFLPICCDHSQRDLETWAATSAEDKATGGLAT